MLGVIVHINNRPIASVYILNSGSIDRHTGETEYVVTDTGVGTSVPYKVGIVDHIREDGWKPLVIEALKLMIKDEKKKKD